MLGCRALRWIELAHVCLLNQPLNSLGQGGAATGANKHFHAGYFCKRSLSETRAAWRRGGAKCPPTPGSCSRGVLGLAEAGLFLCAPPFLGCMLVLEAWALEVGGFLR